jgi:excinuclease ABC subunit C
MRETLKRRFARSAQADELDGSAWALPDLVILDGGKGQLSAGLDALAEAGRLQIPIVALAKEREELFRPDQNAPIVLPRTSQGLYLVQRIRDEAHRFAVTYHQAVRAKRAVRSALDDVTGVGPAKKRALLRTFGSVRGMREAPLDDVAAVAGVGPVLAKRIKDALDS